ncbi:DUF456 domain-containing protein [Fontivita pretiosa]|jgi:uncharacterized protein YqgC (DUF456 family)|uniref:DUF456 domain-containing protein n=1 Tax=Fontivita pretiosa TaxID=2989684 RepID=UPI003D18764F
MLDWLYYLLLLAVSLVGLFLNILGLPGLWLMVASAAGYALLTDAQYMGWPTLITLVVLAAIAELLEFVAGAAGSKAAGGRTRGMIGAIVGAILGGIFLSIIPIPVISTILGACLGAFIGAAVMELSDRDFRHAITVGVGAAKGRFMGILVKGAVGVVMLAVILFAGLPVGGPVAGPTPAAPSTSSLVPGLTEPTPSQ